MTDLAAFVVLLIVAIVLGWPLWAIIVVSCVVAALIVAAE